MNNQTVYLGIDVSKQTLQIDPFDSKKTIIPNSKKALHSLIRRIKAQEGIMICCEATGGYERLLVTELLDAQIPVGVLNPKQVRDFAKSKGILAKTDKIDAGLITLFAQQNCPKPLQPQPEWINQLQSLLTRRDETLRMITLDKNRLEPAPRPEVSRMIKSHVRFLQRQVEAIDKQLKMMVQDIQELKDLYTRFTQVKSIGIVSALHLIGFVPELGEITDKQAAALVGVAPFNNDSGKKKGIRRIQGGRKKVRKALYMAAISASLHNPILKDFYQRLIAKGKTPKMSLVAVMRKLVVLVNRIAADPEFKIA